VIENVKNIYISKHDRILDSTGKTGMQLAVRHSMFRAILGNLYSLLSEILENWDYQ